MASVADEQLGKYMRMAEEKKCDDSMDVPSGPTVAVIGGGIAGLVALDGRRGPSGVVEWCVAILSPKTGPARLR